MKLFIRLLSLFLLAVLMIFMSVAIDLAICSESGSRGKALSFVLPVITLLCCGLAFWQILWPRMYFQTIASVLMFLLLIGGIWAVIRSYIHRGFDEGIGFYPSVLFSLTTFMAFVSLLWRHWGRPENRK